MVRVVGAARSQPVERAAERPVPSMVVVAAIFVAPCRKLGGERVKLRGASVGVSYSGTAHVWRRGGTAYGGRSGDED